jgi:acyl-CoA reductase-like NAD-dependent aldehyde dehydrogenase
MNTVLETKASVSSEQESVSGEMLYENIINGKHVAASSGATLPVWNPATGKPLGNCAASTAEDIHEAVIAARNALAGKWSRTPPAQRTKLLFRAAGILESRMQEIAEIETLNTGKPVAHTLGEIRQAVEDFEYFAGAATKVGGQVPPVHGAFHAYTMKEPVGVVAAITPWNYPLMLAAWKLAPALAAGCTVVIKPSELTPITTNILVEILHEAGIPEGVVNVVHGTGPVAGAALVQHPDVNKISFTGGTATGREIARAAATTIKRVTLELGGKSPAIICDDATLDDAILGSLFSIFYGAGQSCEARSRIYVHESLYDRFVERFVRATEMLKVGDPFDESAQVGALISPERVTLMEEYVAAARKDGGKILTGGMRLKLTGELAGGNFFAPTVITDVPESGRCIQEEIFGPMVVIAKWKTEEEVIAQANGVIYGLAASVYTQNILRAQRFIRALQAGVVTINTPATALPGLPFGGYKQSGVGRELGLETLDSYLETKTVITGVLGKPVNPFGIQLP